MNEQVVRTAVQLSLNGGIVDGKMKVNRRTFSIFDVNAMNEDLYDASVALASLFEDPLAEIQSVKVTLLTEV